MIEKLFSAASEIPPEWQFWPFGPGFGERLLPSLAKLGFVALILGAIFLFLRILFGPGGRFRDKQMDKEAEEMRQRELKDLEERYERGEVSDIEYRYEKKRILS